MHARAPWLTVGDWTDTTPHGHGHGKRACERDWVTGYCTRHHTKLWKLQGFSELISRSSPLCLPLRSAPATAPRTRPPAPALAASAHQRFRFSVTADA